MPGVSADRASLRFDLYELAPSSCPLSLATVVTGSHICPTALGLPEQPSLWKEACMACLPSPPAPRQFLTRRAAKASETFHQCRSDTGQKLKEWGGDGGGEDSVDRIASCQLPNLVVITSGLIEGRTF